MPWRWSTARRLLPEPALARQAGAGHPDRDEESDGCERVDPERDGGTEEKKLEHGKTSGSFPAEILQSTIQWLA